jgi:hypothetical protein
MQPLQLPVPTEEQLNALDELYRSTREVRQRTRAQMVLLACEPPDGRNRTRVARETRGWQWLGALSQGAGGVALRMEVIFFFLDSLNGSADLLDTIVQFETGRVQR